MNSFAMPISIRPRNSSRVQSAPKMSTISNVMRRGITAHEHHYSPRLSEAGRPDKNATAHRRPLTNPKASYAPSKAKTSTKSPSKTSLARLASLVSLAMTESANSLPNPKGSVPFICRRLFFIKFSSRRILDCKSCRRKRLRRRGCSLGLSAVETFFQRNPFAAYLLRGDGRKLCR
jgi:hypothetical protein